MNLKELENRIQMKFPNDKLEEILYHASYQPQDSNLLKRNKEYIYWGHTIIDAAYSLYLYQHDRNLSEGELSSKLAKAYRYFENSIFEKYKLEDFVIKSNGELNQFHPDIAAKLIVLMYQQYGFIKVYDFLLPFFETPEAGINMDYKTIVQEYAQAKKLSPIYEIIDVSGPDHEKKYTCKVAVGKMIATAEAIGKKKAEKEAAKQFALKYNVRLTKKEGSKTIKNQIRTLSDERKKEIDFAIKSLHLNDNFISYRQMDEVLMHRSYANEHRNQGYHSNACISIVGANVLSMLCVEYIFENYDISQVTITKERGVLLKEDNLARSIPDASIKYILKSTQAENEKTRIRLKIDVLKSVIGMMWRNYVSQNNNTIADFAKEYSYKVIAASAKEKVLDFRTFLQEVTQIFDWSFANECKIKTYNADNSTVFISTITVKGTDWEEIGSGAGGTKVAATNAAAKDVLSSIVSHCSENKMVETAILRMLDPELLCEYESKKKLRPKMIEVSVGESEVSDKKPENVKPMVEQDVELKSIPKEKVPQEVSFDGAEHVLYVCKGTISCRKHGHEIVSSTGIFASLSGKQIKININYCKTCKVFFISLSEYKYYQNLYGAILGNILIRQTIEYSGYRYDRLADESILHMCGYTVNQTDNLSNEQRRRILGNLMDREIISKYRIIEYLQFFINSSKYRYNMRLANQKWSDDLKWVRSYNIDKQRKYIVTTLEKWY